LPGECATFLVSFFASAFRVVMSGTNDGEKTGENGDGQTRPVRSPCLGLLPLFIPQSEI